MSAVQEVVKYERRKSEGLMILHGSVDIFEAAALYTAVRRAAGDAKAATVGVNFTGVESIDVSAIQMLLALRRDIEARGRRFQIRGGDSVLAKIFAPLGVSLEP